MRRTIRPAGRFGSGFFAVLTALTLVGVLSVAPTGPTFAADPNDKDHDRSEVRAHDRHDDRSHHDRDVRRVYHPTYGYDVPFYGVYPPPVVYAPPPPPPGINIVVPLHIR